jgi:hypothetical protein
MVSVWPTVEIGSTSWNDMDNSGYLVIQETGTTITLRANLAGRTLHPKRGEGGSLRYLLRLMDRDESRGGEFVNSRCLMDHVKALVDPGLEFSHEALPVCYYTAGTPALADYSNGFVSLYDPTNADAGKYLMDKIWANYVDNGVHNFWLDSDEGIALGGTGGLRGGDVVMAW